MDDEAKWKKAAAALYSARAARRAGDLLARDRHRLHRPAPRRRLAAGRRHHRHHGRDRRDLFAPRLLKAKWDRDRPVKRFWKAASVEEGEGGWTILARRQAAPDAGAGVVDAPDLALAEAIAAEWNAVAEAKIDPHGDAADRPRQCRDRPCRARPRGVRRWRSRNTPRATLLCYRAEGPSALVERQAADWDRPAGLGAAAASTSISPSPPAFSRSPSRRRPSSGWRMTVEALDAFQLAGLSPLVTIGGSLVAASRVLDGSMRARPRRGSAVSLDERWQAEQWGADAEAEAGACQPPPRFPRRGAVPELLDA